jgi:hypothetical protein
VQPALVQSPVPRVAHSHVPTDSRRQWCKDDACAAQPALVQSLVPRVAHSHVPTDSRRQWCKDDACAAQPALVQNLVPRVAHPHVPTDSRHTCLLRIRLIVIVSCIVYPIVLMFVAVSLYISLALCSCSIIESHPFVFCIS